MAKAATEVSDDAPRGRTPTGRVRRRPLTDDSQSTAQATQEPAVANGVADFDFLTQKRQEIENRMQELKPLVEEHDRLLAAHDALESVR